MNDVTVAGRRQRNWSSYCAASADSTVVARLLSYREKVAGGCYEWRGAINNKGYGVLEYAGRTLLAHRLALLVANGEFDPDLDVDHLCRNRSCVNPAHLEAVTHLENIRRAVPFLERVVRDHCSKGHQYTEENLRIVDGARRCVKCDTAAYKSRPSRAKRAWVDGLPTTCRGGHAYTPLNTAITFDGFRRCRECTRLATKARNMRAS